jgi:hypothetical protein
LRALLARRAVDQALALTGPMPPEPTAPQRRKMAELVDAADSLAGDAVGAWLLLVEGFGGDQDAQLMVTLGVVQAVALLAIGRVLRVASSSGGESEGGGGDAPLQ